MSARRRVAGHAEVPISKGVGGGGAGARARLGPSSCVTDCIEQADGVLLVLRSCTRARHAGVERAVLPDNIVGQKRIRDALTTQSERKRDREHGRSGECLVHQR